MKQSKKQLVSKSNKTDRSDTEPLDTEVKNIEANLSDQKYKRATRANVQKYNFIAKTKFVDKNTPTSIVNRHGKILNIPKKRFRDVETTTSTPSENNQSNIFSKNSEPDSYDQSNHLDLTQEIEGARQNKYSKSSTKKRSVRSISSSTYESREIKKNNTTTTVLHSDSAHNEKTNKLTNTFDEKSNTIPVDIQLVDFVEQSNFTETAQGTNVSIQDSSAPNSIPDPSHKIHVIDDTTIKPLSSFTEQNSIPTYHMNNQPLLLNVIQTVNDSVQNNLPLNTFYHCVAPPNPIVELSQKMDKIQESLIVVTENLNHVVQAQKKLQDTQNDIKIELENLKMQSLAYENRENWLAENGIILPMKTKEEFTQFCTLLEQSLECRKIFETSIHFAINSKRSLTRNIASVIRKYFVCELANQFTAVRYVKNKDVMANTLFYKHLLKNFLQKSADGLIFSGVTEGDFKKALGEVLCNVKDCKKEKPEAE